MKRTMATFVLCTCAAGPLRSDEPRFDAGREVADAVRLVESVGTRAPRLDEHGPRRWIASFVRELDPRGLYFVAPDVAEWRRAARGFAESARRGDLALPRRIVEQYRTRVGTAMEYARRAVDEKHRFDVEESCPRSFDDWATDADALHERWRLDVKRAFLLDRLHLVEPDDTRARLRDRHDRLARHAEDFDDERLAARLIDGLLRDVDPHGDYLGPTELAEFTKGFLRDYDLGLRLVRRRGRWYLGARAGRTIDAGIPGRELLAVRRVDRDEVIDVVEMDDAELHRLLVSPLGRIGTETDVLLELYDPVRTERLTLSWPRWQR